MTRPAVALAVAAGVTVVTALSWFLFPGHTWLQQDTQIYVPILEHLRDPAVLRKDLLVADPHVSFTLYDETARALSALTGLEFRGVLEAEQFATRALGVWGLYLMATAMGLSAPASLLVAAILTLGANIGGPAVLSVEIEPDPRGFAVPLLFLGIGLVAHKRWLAAGIAGAAAFLFHPPTVYPFWAVLLCLALVERRFKPFVPLIVASIILLIAARYQQGAGEPQMFFSRLTPELESLQRLRASYSYISDWWRDWWVHYLVLYIATLLGYLRLRSRAPRELRGFLIGLPLVGILSVPLSWLLLERWHWALMPQVQPMRALLFVTVIAQFCAAAAGLLAAQSRRYIEACAWFVLAYLVPVNVHVDWMPSWRQALTIALLTASACVAGLFTRRLTQCCVVAAAGFFLIPGLAGVTTHPQLHTPELAQLSGWARTSTSPDAVFLFADAGKQLYPGIFRAEALRAVYVDWKGGGQVNYFAGFAHEWWRRWSQHQRQCSPGIDYMVLQPRHRLKGPAPRFENASFLVYSCVS
jgi:hypothetical protein